MTRRSLLDININLLLEYKSMLVLNPVVGYLIFMIIGIASYLTIPSIANMVVNAGGGGALTGKVTSMIIGGAGAVVTGGLASGGANSGYFSDKVSGKS